MRKDCKPNYNHVKPSDMVIFFLSYFYYVSATYNIIKAGRSGRPDSFFMMHFCKADSFYIGQSVKAKAIMYGQIMQGRTVNIRLNR